MTSGYEDRIKSCHSLVNSSNRSKAGCSMQSSSLELMRQWMREKPITHQQSLWIATLYQELLYFDTNYGHSPNQSVIVQRYRFYSRFHKPNELITTFVAKPRSLVKDCNFGQTLEENLRDRLICGVNDQEKTAV